MKNIRTSLFILASVCLIGLLVPCGAFAQDGEDDPCCFNVPSGITSPNFSSIQLLSGIPMSLLSVPAEMPVQMSSGVAAVIAGRETGMPFLAEARKLNYVR
jgi:hypothetical protein